MKINVPELRRLQAHLRSLPNLKPDEYVHARIMCQWQQTVRKIRTYDKCGTVGCIAGEYLTLAGIMLAADPDGAASRALGLPNNWLFYVASWPEKWQTAYARCHLEDLAAQRRVMCDVIDDYIATNGWEGSTICVTF